jgi:hypothetical protein
VPEDDRCCGQTDDRDPIGGRPLVERVLVEDAFFRLPVELRPAVEAR